MLEMHFFVTSSLKHSCRVQQHECKVILTCCSNMLSGGVAGGSMCFVMGMVFESIATAVRIYLLFSLVVGL